MGDYCNHNRTVTATTVQLQPNPPLPFKDSARTSPISPAPLNQYMSRNRTRPFRFEKTRPFDLPFRGFWLTHLVAPEALQVQLLRDQVKGHPRHRQGLLHRGKREKEVIYIYIYTNMETSKQNWAVSMEFQGLRCVCVCVLFKTPVTCSCPRAIEPGPKAPGTKFRESKKKHLARGITTSTRLFRNLGLRPQCGNQTKLAPENVRFNYGELKRSPDGAVPATGVFIAWNHQLLTHLLGAESKMMKSKMKMANVSKTNTGSGRKGQRV